MPKVSIIIPVYNTEQYLRECLDSVINQTLKDIEIICVNDGSSDNSLAILEEYAAKDKRIKIISQENQGQSVARNIGIEEAKGEYVGFVDSDDWVDLDFFEKLYTTVKKTNADIACANIYKPNEKRYYIKYKNIKTATKTSKKYILTEIPKWNYIWNKIYKLSALRKENFQFKPNVYYEDIIWSPKTIYYLKKVVTVPNITYYYRYNPNSTVWNYSQKHKTDFINAQLEVYDFIKKQRIFCSTKNFKHVAEKYLKCFGVKLFKQKDFIFCNKYYLFGKIPCLEVWNFDCSKNLELKTSERK